MKLKISLILILLVSIWLDVKSDDRDSLIISDEIEISVQTSYLSYGTNDDNNDIYVERYVGVDLFLLEITQIGGDLNLQNLHINVDWDDWDPHPLVPDVLILPTSSGATGRLEIVFELSAEDQNPGDHAVVQFRRKSAASINDLNSQPWRTSTFTINVEDPTVTNSDPVCSTGGTASISNLPSGWDAVEWNLSPNLDGDEEGTSIDIEATGTGLAWVEPILIMLDEDENDYELTCEKTGLWAGAPPRPNKYLVYALFPM